jgi:hypothetical protein
MSVLINHFLLEKKFFFSYPFQKRKKKKTRNEGVCLVCYEAGKKRRKKRTQEEPFSIYSIYYFQKG